LKDLHQNQESHEKDREEKKIAVAKEGLRPIMGGADFKGGVFDKDVGEGGGYCPGDHKKEAQKGGNFRFSA